MKIFKLPEPRRYDCANYSTCLMAAAVKNYHGNLCRGCDNYIKIGVSDGYIDNVSLSSKQEYIQYEIG